MTMPILLICQIIGGFCKIFIVFSIHPYCDDEQLYLDLSADMILP